MTDMSPAWLIEDPKALLFPGDVAEGRGTGNGSLDWRAPREQREAPGDSPIGAPVTEGGHVEFKITFDFNNSLILIILAIFLVAYIVAAVFLMVKRWWGGRKPLYILKWPPTSIKSTNPYLVTIATGTRKDAGTDGTFVFSIHGFNCTSDQYFINGRSVDYERKLLSKRGSDAFLITCDEELGNIAEVSVTLWAMDPDEKLFLSYITIQDIKRNVSTYLPLHKWIYAKDGGAEELFIDAVHKKTVNQALDNIVSGFRERYIWLSSWLSTTLGSKLDSIYSATLCYLTVTGFSFAAVIFFYTSYYDRHSYMTTRAFIYVTIAATIIFCLVTALHMAMRLIRAGTGDFAECYSPVLLRDMSSSLHVHWDLEADQTAKDGTTTTRGHGAGTPRKARQRKGTTSADRNTQRNNSNPDKPLREKKHPTMTSQRVVSVDAQFNNNNRSRGDIFQAFPSSNCRATDSIKSCFVPSGDDASAICENFNRARFQNADNASVQSRSYTPPFKHTPLGQTSNYDRPKTSNHFGTWRTPTRSNSGFGSFKSPATESKITSRRYESYADVPSSFGMSAGSFGRSQRNSCLKSTNSDLDCGALFSTSTGPPAGQRSVAFKCPMDEVDLCSKYFSKTSGTDTNQSIFGSSLPRSDDWKIPRSTAGANDTRFSSRSIGPSSRLRGGNAKIFRSLGDYDDNWWGLGAKEDYVERSLCRGIGSTKKFSFPKQSEYQSSDRFYRARDPCHGMLPTISPSLQTTCGNADQILENFRCANPMASDLHVSDFGRSRENDEVKLSWNSLWNCVKPRADGTKGDPNAADAGGSRSSPDVCGPVLTEMRGFAGKLVENIIDKIKMQMKSPDQCVDLTDCEFDIESFVRQMSQRMAASGGGGGSGAAGLDDFDCGGRSGPCDDPCAGSRFEDFDGGGGGRATPDPLADRIAQTVTDGSLKTSLAMLDDRVATIVKDVEKVRANIIDRMRQELGLEPEGASAVKEDFPCVGPQCGMSASDTSVIMSSSKGKKDRDRYGAGGGAGAGYLPRDDISQAMTDAKLNRVARTSVENVLNNRDAMDSARDNTKAAAEGDLKSFANDVVQSLYMAVRTKLQQMLKHEYDLAEDGTVPFPTEELLKKADHEVQEQVLPTVVEHIVWLMKEEAKVMGQLDCDMMMIAFAGQYVDTIVTNAVLKTHVDMTQKRAYTRTFVVTSNSNKNNNVNNNNVNNNSVSNSNNKWGLGSVLERCLSETTLSMATLAGLSATRLEVEEVLRETSVYSPPVDAELAQLQILCCLVEKFITRLRGTREGVRSVEEAVQMQQQRVGDAGRDGEETAAAPPCPHCRSAAAQSVVARCLTPISAKVITDLILDEATKNLDACGRIVESNLMRCNRETMVALGRALLDGSSRSGDHLLILESVTAELKAVSLDRATAKVVDDLLAIGDASRAEAERELSRRLDQFTEDAMRRTEKLVMKTAIRENHQQNNSHFEVDFYPPFESNVNYNAATSPTSDVAPLRTGQRERKTDPDKPKSKEDKKEALEEDEEKDPDEALDKQHPAKQKSDADNVVDEMIGIRNSLTRIADEDDCLTGKCRLHRGRLSRTLPSSRCENLHYGDLEFPDDDQAGQQSRTGAAATKTHLTQTLNEIEGCTLSDLWRDPNAFRYRCLVFLGHLVLGCVLLFALTLLLGSIMLGLQLTASQAQLWLLLVAVGVALHALLLEPLKVLVLAVCWTMCRNDLIQ